MLSIEFRKLKSTGFLPSMVIGGILAALIPVLNTAARPDTFTSQTGPVLSILLTANAQMILLLHLILVICGACTMFHTEYAGRALNHMLALPLRPEGLYLKKAVILILCFLLLLTLEAAGLSFCASSWFGLSEDFFPELIRYLGSIALLSLPTILFMLLTALLNENMWVSLGIGITFLSMATVLTDGPFALKLVPFLTPFAGLEETCTVLAAGDTFSGDLKNLLLCAVTETIILIIAAIPAARTRRYTL